MRTLLFCTLALGLGLTALPLHAQSYTATVSSCNPPDGVPVGHLEWPAASPVWSFDFLRPSNSTGARASGLELQNVTYNGRLVFNRAHAPVLNVEYDGSGCGCYRDWQYQEVRFQADGVRAGNENCVADATAGFVQTTCDANDAGGSGGDVGSFTGVAIEDFGTELVLTAHMQAGWYRYRMKWHFYLDGRIWPEYSFSAADNICTDQDHRHHAYWRFDFDLDGSGTDAVREINPATSTETLFTTEVTRTSGDPSDGIFWDVRDEVSGFGYEILPGALDRQLPIDAFSKFDAAVAVYNPLELDDGANSLGECPIRMTEPGYSGAAAIVNDESLVGQDVVFWYRSGALHPAGSPWQCDIVGPLLMPLSAVANEPGPSDAMPEGYVLERAYPNPFNPSTTVRFQVAQAQHVTLALYDALGRQVAVLFEGFAEANRFESVRVDGSGLPSGTYTVRLEGESVNGSTRVVLLK